MDVHSTIRKLFTHAAGVGLEGIFQFCFDSETALWFEAGARARSGNGLHATPDVVVEVSAVDFSAIISAQCNIEDLFASGRLKITGNLGLATLLPQMVELALGGASTTAIKANQRYPARQRLSDELSASQPTLSAVVRRPRSGLSAVEFYERYVRHGIPLVITEALKDWPLFAVGREGAIQIFAELQGITRQGNYVTEPFSTKRDFRSLPMADYIDQLDGLSDFAVSDEAPVYMGNNILPNQLLEYIRYPDYFKPELYVRPRIWIGPKGTLTPLHRDDSDNLFAQVWGRKSFILAAPHHREALGTWSTSPNGGLEGCDINPKSPDANRWSSGAEVQFISVELDAGDLLFLPEGWFHQVESLSTSLSVNFWVDSGRGWKYSPLPE